jgi:hypothetical protein
MKVITKIIKYNLPLINLFYRSSQRVKKAGYLLNFWVLIVSNICREWQVKDFLLIINTLQK